MSNAQGLLKRGIYEFDDPSGTILAARVPHSGTADLYDKTRIIVSPAQNAIFVYNGNIADVLPSGNHEVRTENTPILTRIANWRFGFESPLRAEIWFIAKQAFSGRRWGTATPILANIPTVGSIPLRAYGLYNVRVKDAAKFLQTLVGSKAIYDLAELDQMVQGQILESIPQSLQGIKEIRQLSLKQNEISQDVERRVNERLAGFGLEVIEIQLLSLSPSKEVLEALEERVAMDIVGDPRAYLIYKLANSLDVMNGQNGQNADPTQIMMSLMLSKGLIGADGSVPTPAAPAKRIASGIQCPACMTFSDPKSSFCSNCGIKL